MKIDSVKVFVVGNPPPSFGGRYFVFLKLRTTCGIEGVGEVYAATFGPHVLASMIEDVFMRRFEGRDPFQIESIWRESYGSGFSLRPDLSLMGVMSGLVVVAGLMVLCCFCVVMGGHSMMVGCRLVMIRCLL